MIGGGRNSSSELRVLLDDLEKTRSVASGFVAAEAANADRGPCYDLRDERDCLSALCTSQKLTFVGFEERLAD